MYSSLTYCSSQYIPIGIAYGGKLGICAVLLEGFYVVFCDAPITYQAETDFPALNHRLNIFHTASYLD